MAWVRVDDSFPDHPKALQVGAFGVALWIEALCYANKHLTDGNLPQHVVAAMRLARHPLKVAETLVAAGLWERIEGGYRIHDYHEHYPTAAEVKAKRAADAARKRDAKPQDSTRNPAGIRQDSTRNPEVRARAGVGEASGSGSGSALKSEFEVGRQVWDLWREVGAQNELRESLEPSHKVFHHCVELGRAYTLDDIRAALGAWWASPFVASRNVGFFAAQIGEVLRHLANGNGGHFRDPKPKPISITAHNDAVAARVIAGLRTS